MESFFDLPAHVFLVHVPVVLIPVLCAAAIALAVRPEWRRRYGIPLVILALVVLVSTLLAFNSGVKFAEAAGLEEVTEKHKDLAQTTRLLVVGLFAAVLGLVLVGRRHDSAVGADERAGTLGQATIGLAGATVILSVLATVWIVRTGHEGAKATWEGVLPGTAEAAPAPTTTAPTTTSTTTSTTSTTTSAPTTTEAESTTSTTTSAPTTTTTTTAPEPAAVDGAVVFADNCARCHGATGGGGRGPSLIANELSAAQMQAQIRLGGGGMPTFQEQLTDPEIAAVVGFVDGL